MLSHTYSGCSFPLSNIYYDHLSSHCDSNAINIQVFCIMYGEFMYLNWLLVIDFLMCTGPSCLAYLSSIDYISNLLAAGVACECKELSFTNGVNLTGIESVNLQLRIGATLLPCQLTFAFNIVVYMTGFNCYKHPMYTPLNSETTTILKE